MLARIAFTSIINIVITILTTTIIITIITIMADRSQMEYS